MNGYCHIADYNELEENEFNLNVPRYVDISEEEKEIEIQNTIDEFKKLEKEREKIQIQSQDRHYPEYTDIIPLIHLRVQSVENGN